MKDKSYAAAALKDILIRALGVVEMKGYCDGYAEGPQGTSLTVADGWDLEFAQMAREEQAAWLVQLCIQLMREHAEDPAFMKTILLRCPEEYE